MLQEAIDAVKQLDALICDPPMRVWIHLLRLDGTISWDVSNRSSLNRLRAALLADEMGPVAIVSAEACESELAA